MNYQEALNKLKQYGSQEHVLKYFDQLTETQQAELLKQIEATDFAPLLLAKDKEHQAQKGVITPLAALQLNQIAEEREKFEKIGLGAIRAGKVGAVLLAGGMGTRLGSDAPKGMYNIGETKDVFIFQRIIENLQDVVRAAQTPVHLFVMTSDKNNDVTIAFFKEKNYFGYDPAYVHFFIQEMAPASDYEGRVYMEEPWKIATSPNGNGGWYGSMARCGMLDIVEQAGIEWLNVFAVDNVLQRIADPVFVGATIARDCVVGSKVVRKAAPDEKVGVMCLEDGRPSIVEYYELTDELMEAKDENGDPAYNFGVILNYLFREDKLREIMNKNMPLHIVEKKIPHIDENGEHIEPKSPNGYKYETLVLDMIHLMDSCLPFEVVREKEFAPIKNKTGVDSVESAKELCRKNGIVL
ncbi:MAG: UDPGP type 1 family protein [Lachnospiraceae bacterium]|nr:UDPGP type 1 family protein [Lachnospiraceae bacterium]